MRYEKEYPPRIVLFVFVVTLLSCGKYEDGPTFSVHTKNERVINTWKIVSGNNLYNNIAAIDKYKYSQNGLLEMTFSGDTAGTQTVKGNWYFYKHKKQIINYFPASTYRHFSFPERYDTLVILRLKEKEFWYRTNEGETHLEQY